MPPSPCPYNPEVLKDAPIGMFHCPLCGEMQIAGLPHLPPEEESSLWGEDIGAGGAEPTPEGEGR